MAASSSRGTLTASPTRRGAADAIEITDPPRFEIGERVASRTLIRNDGSYGGREIGAPLVQRGDIGWVCSVGTFLQRCYIYAVEFPDRGVKVGMRARELCTLDRLPADVLARLGERAARLRDLHAAQRIS